MSKSYDHDKEFLKCTPRGALLLHVCRPVLHLAPERVVRRQLLRRLEVFGAGDNLMNQFRKKLFGVNDL
jgi:hypothetical protein